MSDLDEVTQIEIGMPVYDGNGHRIGTLEAIDQQALRFGGHAVPIGAVERIRPDGIHLARGVALPDTARALEDGTPTRAAPPGTADRDYTAPGVGLTGDSDTFRIPVAEERLYAERRPTQGEVEIRKRVERSEEIVRETLEHDTVEVERVPINRHVDGPVAQRMDGEWLVVPVLEEVLVVEKRLLLKEEVRIRTRKHTRQAELREPVRRERVDVMPVDGTPSHHVVERGSRDTRGITERDVERDVPDVPHA
jgi:uncharacterized protein (TIGR02271 family)